MKPILALAASLALLSACEEIDTSALQEIQDTAAQAQAAVAQVNSRSAQLQHAIENPGGALLAAVGATFSKTPTDEPGVYVLTDLQTGCQFLATYGADRKTVASIAPRMEAVAGGAARQRCVHIPGGASGSEREQAEAETEAEG